MFIKYFLQKSRKFEGFENLKNATTVPLTKWSLETGYEERSPFLYPFRVSGSGENGGLKFEIWRKIDEAKASTSITKGFKLVIHLPCEIPQFDKQYYRIPLEKSATLIVRPSMTVKLFFINLFSFLTQDNFIRLQMN